jgi:hypothetical protein
MRIGVALAAVTACPIAAWAQVDLDISQAVGNGNFGIVTTDPGGTPKDVLNLSILNADNTSSDQDYILLKIDNKLGRAETVGVRIWARNVDGDANTLVRIENVTLDDGAGNRPHVTYALNQRGSGRTGGAADPAKSWAFESTPLGTLLDEDLDMSNPNVVARASGLDAADAGGDAFLSIDSASIGDPPGGTLNANLALADGINILRLTSGRYCQYTNDSELSGEDTPRDDDAQISRIQLTFEETGFTLLSGTDISTETITGPDLAGLPAFTEDCPGAVVADRLPAGETFDMNGKTIMYMHGVDNIVRPGNVTPEETSGYPYNLLADQGASIQYVGDSVDDPTHIAANFDALIIDDKVSSGSSLGAEYQALDLAVMTWEGGHGQTANYDFTTNNGGEWASGPCIRITNDTHPITSGLTAGKWYKVYTTPVGRGGLTADMFDDDLASHTTRLARAGNGSSTWFVIDAGAKAGGTNKAGVWMFFDRPCYAWLTPTGETFYNRTVAWMLGIPLSPITNPDFAEECNCAPTWLDDPGVETQNFTGKKVRFVVESPIAGKTPEGAAGVVIWGLHNQGVAYADLNGVQGTAAQDGSGVAAAWETDFQGGLFDFAYMSQSKEAGNLAFSEFLNVTFPIVTAHARNAADHQLYQTYASESSSENMVIHTGHPITDGLVNGATYQVHSEPVIRGMAQFTGTKAAGTVVLGETPDGDACFLAMDAGATRLDANPATRRHVQLWFSDGRADAISTGGTNPATAITGDAGNDIVKSAERLTPLGATLVNRSIAWACGVTLSPIQNPPNPVAPPVPTVTQWGTIFLAVILVAAAGVVMRRRRTAIA